MTQIISKSIGSQVAPRRPVPQDPASGLAESPAAAEGAAPASTANTAALAFPRFDTFGAAPRGPEPSGRASTAAVVGTANGIKLPARIAPGEALGFVYARTPEDTCKAYGSLAGVSGASDRRFLQQNTQAVAILMAKPEQVFCVYRVGMGPWQQQELSPVGRSFRTGTELGSSVNIPLPARAKGEIELFFAFSGCGNRLTLLDDNLGQMYRVQIGGSGSVQQPRPELAQVVDGTVGTRVQRLFPLVDTPQPASIALKHFASHGGAPVVFADANGVPVDGLAARHCVRIQGNDVDVVVRSEAPLMSEEEQLAIGMTCFSTAQDIKERVTHLLQEPLRWYNDRPLQVWPFRPSEPWQPLNAWATMLPSSLTEPHEMAPGVLLYQLDPSIRGADLTAENGWRVGCMARDPNVIAHEVWHHVLFGLLYDRFGDFIEKGGAMRARDFGSTHEFFACTGSMLTRLHYAEVLDKVHQETGGDLERRNMISHELNLTPIVAKMSQEVSSKDAEQKAMQQLAILRLNEPTYQEEAATALRPFLDHLRRRRPNSQRTAVDEIETNATLYLEKALAQAAATLDSGARSVGPAGIEQLLRAWATTDRFHSIGLHVANSFRDVMIQALVDKGVPRPDAQSAVSVWLDLPDKLSFAAARKLFGDDPSLRSSAEFRAIVAERVQPVVQQWLRDNFDDSTAVPTRQLPGREPYDCHEKEPHKAAVPAVSVFYEVLRERVKEELCARTTTNPPGPAEFSDAVGKVVGELEAVLVEFGSNLPHPRHWTWGVNVGLILKAAARHMPNHVHLWRRALDARGFPPPQACPQDASTGARPRPTTPLPYGPVVLRGRDEHVQLNGRARLPVNWHFRPGATVLPVLPHLTDSARKQVMDRLDDPMGSARVALERLPLSALKELTPAQCDYLENTLYSFRMAVLCNASNAADLFRSGTLERFSQDGQEALLQRLVKLAEDFNDKRAIAAFLPTPLNGEQAPQGWRTVDLPFSCSGCFTRDDRGLDRFAITAKAADGSQWRAAGLIREIYVGFVDRPRAGEPWFDADGQPGCVAKHKVRYDSAASSGAQGFAESHPVSVHVPPGKHVAYRIVYAEQDNGQVREGRQSPVLFAGR